MFMGTLIGPFFNLWTESSSDGFTEMILTGERIESGIKSGVIPMATSLNVVKKPFRGKKEVKNVYGQKSRSKSSHNQFVEEVLISNMAPARQ